LIYLSKGTGQPFCERVVEHYPFILFFPLYPNIYIWLFSHFISFFLNVLFNCPRFTLIQKWVGYWFIGTPLHLSNIFTIAELLSLVLFIHLLLCQVFYSIVQDFTLSFSFLKLLNYILLSILFTIAEQLSLVYVELYLLHFLYPIIEQISWRVFVSVSLSPIFYSILQDFTLSFSFPKSFEIYPLRVRDIHLCKSSWTLSFYPILFIIVELSSLVLFIPPFLCQVFYSILQDFTLSFYFRFIYRIYYLSRNE